MKSNLLPNVADWTEFSYRSLFDIKKGKRLTKQNMNPGTTPFVGSSAVNNGVTGFISQDAIFPAGVITVSYDGSIAEAFYQPEPFWALDSVNILIPKFKITPHIALFLCALIRKEKYRYNYGRKWHIGRMMRSTIFLPSEENEPNWRDIQKFMESVSRYGDLDKDLQHLKEPELNIDIHINPNKWKEFCYKDIFDIKKGKRLTKQNMKPGTTPFVGSSDAKNGLTAKIAQKPIHDGNTISVCYNGSVAEAFYQPEPFWATDDVNVLYPKFELNKYTALFLTTLIRKEKYRFNYGRKWHLGRMNESIIKLPVNENNDPDWLFMENYIKSLPFSSGV